jgi:hypothetical protein
MINNDVPNMHTTDNKMVGVLISKLDARNRLIPFT